jgi:FAD/FMN-containing dehydrogenase
MGVFEMTEFLTQARALLGEAHVLTTDLAAYATDWRGKFTGVPLAVLRPGDTVQVAAAVKLCATHGVAIVPQGGNTSMCGGATPDGSGQQVVLSLSRLNRVRNIDPLNNTMTVEAGCVLQTLQELASEHDRLFPLSLGAEGSCQIGGNIATNAGGVQVLRYGNTRDLVLGLEVVLADGQVLNLLRALRKDNTGYDLKHLFIGSEGTLGIITAAVLKLFPAPHASAVAFAAFQTPQQALQLLGLMRGALGDRFTAFELMSEASVAMVRQYFPATPALFAETHPWHVLMQATDPGADEGAQAALDTSFQAALEQALETGVVDDVVVATSVAQAEELWAVRENISEAQQHDGHNIKHDIAVPVSSVAAFIEEVQPLLHAAYTGVRPIVYGHLGDGNLHFNVSRPAGWSTPDWQGESDRVNAIVLDVVARMQGSFSAEHGLGQLKNHEMALYKTPLEIDVMRRVKQALDPQGLMNPGKLLPV